MFRPVERSPRTTARTARRVLATTGIAITALALQSLPVSALDEGDSADARASILSVGGTPVAGSAAQWDSNPGPNSSGPVTTIPLSDLIAFGEGGGVKSVSTTTSPYDAHAIAGLIGSDGQVTLDETDGGFAPARVDLLALLRKGGADLTGVLVDEAELRLGVGGAELRSVGGVLQDPDLVGGPGRYRLGQADLDLHSPAIDEAAAKLYDAVGTVDTLTEETVNRLLSLTTLTKALPLGATLTARVSSDMQDQVFRKLVAEPITTKNKVLTVDFSTGTATLHLDQLMHGEEVVDGPLLPGQTVRPGDPTGLNNQLPNTEIIDDEIYPMIAETVHDLMDEVLTIVVGAVEGALSSVTIDFTSTLRTALGSAVATWQVNLGTGKVAPARCAPLGLAGPMLCTTLTTTINTVVVPLINAALVPVREALIGDAGATLYGLAMQDLKTGLITIPVRKVLDPFLAVLAQNVSMQVNSQRPLTCVAADGTRATTGLDLSAFSLGLRRAGNGPRVDLGNARVSTRCAGTLAR